jgi:DNA invertase Pin-like site-specific DNA recombinase
MNDKPLKVAIYARVSTSDQDCGSQLAELHSWCDRFHYEIVKEYVDAGVSGAKASRPALDELMTDARARRFEAVLVYKLDRFGRSMRQLINNIEALRDVKVRFIAISQGIDTDQSNAVATVLFHLLGAFSEFERTLISERIRTGIEHARKQGKALGPKRKVWRHDLALDMREKGVPWEVIAARLKVSSRTIRRGLNVHTPRAGSGRYDETVGKDIEIGVE